jgi:proline iminopeptidase
MFSDTVQVVNYLRTRFQQDKIYIFGHSWGSVLGLSLAYHHPDLLHAYIGAGQIINTRLNEQKGFADTLQLATQKQHRKAMDALLQMTSFQQDHVAISLDEFMILRKWQFHLNGLGLKKSELIRILVAALCVPEYNLLDYISLISSMLKVSKSKQVLNDVMQVNFNNQTNFSTPIILFGCGKDYLTHSSFVDEYFQKINAPYKKFIDLLNAGHNLFFDDPKQFICGVESALVAAKLDHMNFS